MWFLIVGLLVGAVLGTLLTFVSVAYAVSPVLLAHRECRATRLHDAALGYLATEKLAGSVRDTLERRRT